MPWHLPLLLLRLPQRGQLESRAESPECKPNRNGPRTKSLSYKEELIIKDACWKRISPHRRSHYNPLLRMRILKLKAARCWNTEQAAKSFLLNEQTITSWLRRIDEKGENALIQLQKPVKNLTRFRSPHRGATETVLPNPWQPEFDR